MLEQLSSKLQSASDDQEKADILNQASWEVKHTDLKYSFALSEEAARLSRTSSYKPGLAYSLRNQGYFYLLEGNAELALINLLEALRLFREINDKAGWVSTLDHIGSVYFKLTGYDNALYHYLESLKIREELNDQIGQVISLNHIATVYEHLGYYDQALNYYLKSLIINEHIGDKNNQINSLNNIGRIYELQGDYEHGINYYQKSLALAKSTQNRKAEADTLSRIGLASEKMEDFETALKLHEESLKIRIEIQDRHGEAISLNNIGNIFEKTSNYLRALTYYFKGWQLFENLGDKFGEAKTLLGIGSMFIKRNEGFKAPKYLYKALSISTEIDAKTLAFQVYLALSISYKQMMNFEKALEFHEKFHEEEKEVLNEQAKEKTKSLVIQFEVDRTQKEAEIYQLKNVELRQAYDEMKKLNESLEKANQQKSELLEKLREQAEALDRQAREDALTKLANRRHFDQRFAEEFERAERYGHHLTMVISDIDFFKKINDKYSHQIGDEVLKQMAKIFTSSCRSVDLVARYGGEEFVFLFPETPLEKGAMACEKIRKNVESFDWSSIAKGLKVTISLGLCENKMVEKREEMVTKADEKLYEAKNNGRNQVRY
ncbi:diguanylate cyclase and serine/threonine protein kinase with TPR repeats [Chloroherpeton thalassium ATCC 35110]|uniref:diguanylate cyclase n=1 Tax=Chloroherpeton thalassium (strain ATCC 35110 / GB-78) TaxID=517418 RepID=B3QV08_CHLT3|nr:diguanylate cyclase [Chloroherpeton thalassium]ACF14509.1 diguanylate cyclase and serine/threonine protein kinase with TPR repeats [Chloroherpeton thalassium ATCC 35110]